DEEIGPAVAVIVEERRRRAPAGVAGAGPGRDIAEGAIAIVVPQLVLVEVHEIQVDETIAVIVAGCDAHAVAARSRQPALCRDIGEVQRARAGSLRTARTRARFRAIVHCRTGADRDVSVRACRPSKVVAKQAPAAGPGGK